MCVRACVLSVCAIGTIGIIISAWEAQLRGGSVEAEFNNGPTMGFVCTEQRADKCRLLLTIYTLLHTPAHVHLTQTCTHSYRHRHLFPLPFISLCLYHTHSSTEVHVHTQRLTHTCCMSMFTVHQCISVTQCKRERWESPCEHITLTEIWPLSHPPSQTVWENWERVGEVWFWLTNFQSCVLKYNYSLWKTGVLFSQLLPSFLLVMITL